MYIEHSYGGLWKKIKVGKQQEQDGVLVAAEIERNQAEEERAIKAAEREWKRKARLARGIRGLAQTVLQCDIAVIGPSSYSSV